MNVTINASESTTTAVSVTAVATDTSAVSPTQARPAAAHDAEETTKAKAELTCPTTDPTAQPSASGPPVVTTMPPPRAARASMPPIPRYAMPTTASVRREEATLRTLTGVVKRDVQAKQPSARRQPTKPRSPNFRSRHRRASVASRTVSMPNVRHAVRSSKRLSVTTPKSPVFRSKGPVRRPVSENESPNRCFVPNPLPDFLKRGDVLPDIKLNAKTMAAMARRNNPDAGRRQEVRPQPLRVNMQPTVPEPFELRGVEKHEVYQQTAEQRRAQELEEERVRRQFEATALDEKILDGPTFVPELRGEPLTHPVDLLPHSKQRSERTLAFEQAQRDRLEEQARLAALEAKRREEEADIQFKQEQEERKFKPKPIPKSHYVPDMIPRAPSVRTASVQNSQSSRLYTPSTTSTTDTSSVQDDSAVASATVSTKGIAVSVADADRDSSIMNGGKKREALKKRVMKVEETSIAVETASETPAPKGEKSVAGTTVSMGANSEPRTPAMDFDIEEDVQTPDGLAFAQEEGNDKKKAGGEGSDVTTVTESPLSETGSTSLMQKMRNSLSPLWGVSREATP